MHRPSRVELVVAAVMLAINLAFAANGGAGPVVLAVAVLATAPLLAVERAPGVVFALTGLIDVAATAFPDYAGQPVGPAVAVMLYAASRPGTAARRRLLAGALALIVAECVAYVLAQGVLQGTAFTTPIVLWGVGWVVGDRERLRRARLSELESQVQDAARNAERERRLAVVEERTAVARELHDSAGHAINVILVHAGAGRLRSAGDQPLRETFELIEHVARDTVADLDGLVSTLRDDDGAVQPALGLAALEGLLTRVRASGLELDSRVEVTGGDVPAVVDRAAYRIVQEGLTNAARHGTGSARLVLDDQGGRLRIVVVNPVRDGPAPDGRRGGHGLVGMRERVALTHGTLEAVDGNGSFRLEVQLPLDVAQR